MDMHREEGRKCGKHIFFFSFLKLLHKNPHKHSDELMRVFDQKDF